MGFESTCSSMLITRFAGEKFQSGALPTTPDHPQSYILVFQLSSSCFKSCAINILSLYFIYICSDDMYTKQFRQCYNYNANLLVQCSVNHKRIASTTLYLNMMFIHKLYRFLLYFSICLYMVTVTDYGNNNASEALEVTTNLTGQLH